VEFDWEEYERTPTKELPKFWAKRGRPTCKRCGSPMPFERRKCLLSYCKDCQLIVREEYLRKTLTYYQLRKKGIVVEPEQFK